MLFLYENKYIEIKKMDYKNDLLYYSKIKNIMNYNINKTNINNKTDNNFSIKEALNMISLSR